MLTAVILAVAYADIPRSQKNMTSVFEIVLQGTCGSGEDPSEGLKSYLRSLGPSHPAYKAAMEIISDNGNTTAGKNVASNLRQALAIFGDARVRSITSKSDFSIHRLIDCKTIVYCHLLEQGDPYQAIYKCFFNQYWTVAQEVAKNFGGRLPRETVILGDEFGNLGRVDCAPQISTLGRAMKLYLYIFVQDLKQLNAYNDPGDYGAGRDRLLGSIGGKVALSLANPEDFAYFTKLVGKHTVRTHTSSQQSQGIGRSGYGDSFNEQADDLIHEWEWQNRVASRDGCIAIIGGENGAPGREGVYELPLTYANRTPAGAAFGLGDEEHERKMRTNIYQERLQQYGSRYSTPDFWCPDFSKYITSKNQKRRNKSASKKPNIIQMDERAVWDTDL